MVVGGRCKQDHQGKEAAVRTIDPRVTMLAGLPPDARVRLVGQFPGKNDNAFPLSENKRRTRERRGGGGGEGGGERRNPRVA